MKYIIMKYLFLLLGLILNFGLTAQNRFNYYVVPVEETSFEIISEDLQRDGTIIIGFSDVTVSNFFANKTIYKFHKAFPTAKTEYLKRVFYISLDNNYMDEFEQLKSINKLDHVSLLGEVEFTFTPNDYNYNGKPNSALELINARQAWDITTGSPNVYIGITDSYFELTHEDLQNQIIQNFIYGSAIPDWHGVAVAGCVAAETNNGKGVNENPEFCWVPSTGVNNIQQDVINIFIDENNVLHTLNVKDIPLTIYDVQGRKNQSVFPISDNYQTNVSSLPKGLYIVSNEIKSISFKIVVK